jgi:hypothetical protein
MQFIFPSNPLDPNKVDEYFKPQAAVLYDGYPAVFSQEEGKVFRVLVGETVMYRGWMLTAHGYHQLKALVERKGAKMFTSVVQYLNTHHIPNWYPLLREFTAETYIIDNMWLSHGCDLVAELQKLGWEKFFLKDYVKSLKTAGGSVVTNAEDALKVVDLMGHYRGELEGGLCVRRFENLSDERRYFILNGKVWPVTHVRTADASILQEIAKRIDSPFFSVDLAYNDVGHVRLVEIGDGQVSDLVGWTTRAFSHMFRHGAYVLTA